jgi:hypothetical protein
VWEQIAEEEGYVVEDEGYVVEGKDDVEEEDWVVGVKMEDL